LSDGHQKHTPGLKANEFRQIAKGGLGDPCNAYPHSMAWFHDHLYIGTTRCNLILLHHRVDEYKHWECWPLKCPKNIWELDLRAQIWRFHPPSGKWSKVLTSPMARASDGTEVPMFFGIRGMNHFKGISDSAPALYAMTWSPSIGPGPLVLRSEDGAQFEQVGKPGLGGRDFTTFRSLIQFKGQLFTAPSGKPGQPNAPDVAMVFSSADPSRGEWEQVNETSFGDPSNLSVFDMTTFNNYLYAGTLNPNGFQVWKTDAEGSPPFRWTQVITHGAGRGPNNEGVGSMCAFNGALYVGSIIQNGGYDRVRNIGPAPSELIRIHPDDSWDLVVGEGRLTKDGLKMPISGLGPGFGNFFIGYLWRMCVHDGWLYVGTLDWSVLLPYMPRNKWSAQMRKILDHDRIEQVMRYEAGFDLWRSNDGACWIPVSKDGFGNPYNWGVRTMVSSPYGLFIGAANPFGPEVAVKRASIWGYEQNPRGGLEVWLGTHDSVEAHLRSVSKTSSSIQCGTTDCSEVEHTEEDSPDAHEKIIADYYDHSGFRHFGAWRQETRQIKQACENLVEELLACLPEKQGKILDLACGHGATTRYLLKYYPAGRVTGVCLEKGDLKRCQKSIHNIKFVEMSVPKLREPGGSFDAVISVEGLSRSNTGIKWLREAVRVLKPGGYLVCSEILSENSKSPWKKKKGWKRVPMADISDFQELLHGLGLREVRVQDYTVSCWQSFRGNLSAYLWAKLLANEIDEEMLEKVTYMLYEHYGPINAYILAISRKPSFNLS
jgi:ubiquinone/menaquinone biosynthesis C-methylase UbiE